MVLVVLPMADTTTAGLSMPRTLLARSLSRWVGGMDDPHKSIKTANPAAGAADPFLGARDGPLAQRGWGPASSSSFQKKKAWWQKTEGSG